jgi:phenylalanine ammonia-lyase
MFDTLKGLAIVNGTAISAGVAALALHEALNLAALSQILTAMSVESLLGTDESFHPFIAKVRPHPGQIDAARNIYSFLAGSKLVFHHDGKEDLTLRQDRYSIRTASQWVGPILEDLMLSWQQLDIEFNSVTDNPLIDVAEETIFHGGNFQAKAVSSAMEKTRIGLQTIGRMLSTQCTEMINPATNRGLPPNLVVDDPSESFIWKGVDIQIAALTSELGFLANPVATHVQTAEMGNQALNSLALVSARYTLQAVDILSELSAAHLIAVCQALDLRAMYRQFTRDFQHEFFLSFQTHLSPSMKASDTVQALQMTLWAAFNRRLDQTMVMDAEKRLANAVDLLLPAILKSQPASLEILEAANKFAAECSTKAFETFSTTRELYRQRPDATPVLGRASRKIYSFIRHKLRVPFYGERDVMTPMPEATGQKQHSGTYLGDMPPTPGSYLTTVYHAIKTGALYDTVVVFLLEITTQ